MPYAASRVSLNAPVPEGGTVLHGTLLHMAGGHVPGGFGIAAAGGRLRCQCLDRHGRMTQRDMDDLMSHLDKVGPGGWTAYDDQGRLQSGANAASIKPFIYDEAEMLLCLRYPNGFWVAGCDETSRNYTPIEGDGDRWTYKGTAVHDLNRAIRAAADDVLCEGPREPDPSFLADRDALADFEAWHDYGLDLNLVDETQAEANPHQPIVRTESEPLPAGML